MKISDLAKKTGVSPRCIRHYEKSGLFQSQRNSSGYRVYSADHIRLIQQIRWLLEADLSLKKIRYILPCTLKKNEVLMCQDLQALFKREIARIEKQMSALRKSQAILKKTLKKSVLVNN